MLASLYNTTINISTYVGTFWGVVSFSTSCRPGRLDQTSRSSGNRTERAAEIEPMGLADVHSHIQSTRATPGSPTIRPDKDEKPLVPSHSYLPLWGLKEPTQHYSVLLNFVSSIGLKL